MAALLYAQFNDITALHAQVLF